MEQALAGLLQHFTYAGMVLLLVAAGMGLPISEDLVLLLAGGFSSQGVTRFVPTLLVGYCGVIAGDVLIYQWGKKLGPKAYEHKLVRKAISAQRAEKLHEHFARHGFWTVVVGRHTPGLRAVVFFLSGASGVRFATFLAADLLSAAVTVPAVVTLGYFFGSHLEDVRRLLHRVHWAVGALALIGVGVWWFVRKRRKSREALLRETRSQPPRRRDLRESSGTRAV